jgi:hypothetical protein
VILIFSAEVFMQCVERAKIKKLAVKRVIKGLVEPCRKCGNKSFLWDFQLMVKTCKNIKCQDVSGVI